MSHSFTSLATEVIEDACQALGLTLPQDISVTEPPAHVSADVATNVAMKLASEVGESPRVIAEKLIKELQSHDFVMTATIAGPGFINIELKNEFYQKLEKEISSTPLFERVKLPESQREKISVEFVSANPSGPIHVGNARGGPLGEAIVRVLESQGNQVIRDFYVNDVGGQADTFGASVLHFYAQLFNQEFAFPENGYRGDYVKEVAATIAKDHGESLLQGDNILSNLREVAVAEMVKRIKHTLDRQGIHFDRWFKQSELRNSGRVANTLELLKSSGHAVEKDGALWLSSGIREDDRETVLVKSNGVTTYFADDLAYHQEKFTELGVSRAICLLGADHSGHPPRMRAGLEAMGFNAKQYQSVVYQYVQLKENGETVGMAKREGRFVSADDVLDEVPCDVFAYFMVSKANETHVDFDLQLAKDTSEKNPVYSIQYAHARICRLLDKALEQGIVPGELRTDSEFGRALLRQVAQFPEVHAEAARDFRINLIPQYLQELSSRFHTFYAAERVIDTEEPVQSSHRLAIALEVKSLLAFGLSLLNISAPEHLERD